MLRGRQLGQLLYFGLSSRIGNGHLTMEKLHKEVNVTIEDFAINSIGSYYQLIDLLSESQRVAERNFGRTALAVYRVGNVFGR